MARIAENIQGDGTCSCRVLVDMGTELFESAPIITPAARALRERIAGNFYATFVELLPKESGTAFAASAIMLDDFTTLDPDVCVVCDPARITASGIVGAPDLVVDIVSSATTLKARRERRLVYERSGVSEYLMVDPEHRVVERFTLIDGRYGAEEVFGWGEMLSLTVFPHLELNLWEILSRESQAEV